MKTIQPTFGDLLAAYPEIAALERLKSERPCVTRVWNVLCGVRRVLDVLGLRGIAARWTLSYYEARGWDVRPFDLPEFRRRTKRYTVTRYYADPSVVNFTGVRIADLIA